MYRTRSRRRQHEIRRQNAHGDNEPIGERLRTHTSDGRFLRTHSASSTLRFGLTRCQAGSGKDTSSPKEAPTPQGRTEESIGASKRIRAPAQGQGECQHGRATNAPRASRPRGGGCPFGPAQHRALPARGRFSGGVLRQAQLTPSCVPSGSRWASMPTDPGVVELRNLSTLAQRAPRSFRVSACFSRACVLS